jgi:hypothetical protein
MPSLCGQPGCFLASEAEVATLGGQQPVLQEPPPLLPLGPVGLPITQLEADACYSHGLLSLP